MADLDFDKWGEMMADDVEYYFPDGDAGTRTKLTGKSEVVGWFKNWKETFEKVIPERKVQGYEEKKLKENELEKAESLPELEESKEEKKEEEKKL